MEITWLGHGTFQFRLPSGQVIVMDPWVEGNPAYPKGHKIARVNTICISHGHFDHIHDAVPVGDLFTMSPHEAALAGRLLRPKKVIPMHFGTFPPLTGCPDDLRERISGLETTVWPLEPGKPVEW
jgi:L-ascorbate metabolism protein UlaG (beta-lactamase superfamily)